MRFAKMHGLGNDFVLVDLRGAGGGASIPDEAFARRVCDRHRGVGGDGILTLTDLPREESANANLSAAELANAARLTIHNPDGSRPEMCGNGVRCAALWIASERCTRPANAKVTLFTEAGVRPCNVAAEAPTSGLVEVGMGRPQLSPARHLALRGLQQAATPVSMGNPHRVFFFDGATSASEMDALCAIEGPALSDAENANIEFVRSLGSQRFSAAVWERGAGATQACGTGACAVAAAAIERGLARADLPIVVELPGGALELWLRNGEMQMRGPAELVFLGELSI